MGTYTTNYQLYMPSVGEQGWGTLINGNFTTIDTTMKELNNRLTAVENEVNGALSCTSVATSGTITSTGLITANGGVTGGTITGTTITATTKFVGTLYGKVYVNAKTTTTKYNNDIKYATCSAIDTQGTIPTGDNEWTSSTMTLAGYSKISMSYPYQLYPGIFILSSSYLNDSVPNLSTRTATFTLTKKGSKSRFQGIHLYVNNNKVLTVGGFVDAGTYTGTYNIPVGATFYMEVSSGSITVSSTDRPTGKMSISAQSDYYLNVV